MQFGPRLYHHRRRHQLDETICVLQDNSLPQEDLISFNSSTFSLIGISIDRNYHKALLRIREDQLARRRYLVPVNDLKIPNTNKYLNSPI